MGRQLILVMAVSCAIGSAVAQDPAEPVQPPEDKRAFGVIPNYRTAEGSAPFQPITTKQKFTIATKDSFDYPVLGTTGFFAGLSQIQGSGNNVYGQGMKGFAHRYGISYADQVVGNFFPEAIVPTVPMTPIRPVRLTLPAARSPGSITPERGTS